jgi:Ser/Thr protein kinase RdoA (MazF antagonist)
MALRRLYRPAMARTIERSLFTLGAVRGEIADAYGLDITGCTLLRSFVNDVYAIVTPARRYVFKVYRHGFWSPGEVAWELDLTRHLLRSGVAVPDVVPLTDGSLLGILDAPEGQRPYTLTAFVESGARARQPFTGELYREFGAATAAFHTAGDTFTTTYPRRSFDLAATLTEPLGLVLAALAAQPEDRAVIAALGEQAQRRIEALIAGGLDWGVVHGDVTMDNVFFGPAGPILYDFDLAGPGFRACDLSGVRQTRHWDAFADGYQRVRPLRDNDLAALPWFTIAGNISNLKFHLVDKPVFAGTESLAEGWAESILTGMRAAATDLLG